MSQQNRKSVFETSVLSTKIKSANVKLFPEGVLGYFLGPTLALFTNSVLSGYLNSYLSNVLNITSWANVFFTWLPVISVVFVIFGNILVGRLMDKGTTKAGKARPLLLVSIPLSILALLVLFVFSPFSTDVINKEGQTWTLVFLAIGYNLWFSLACPFYSTSHAALVSFSTRNSKDRSLLATISNATGLAAIGLSSMILPFFLKLLFVYQKDPDVISQIPDASSVLDESGNVLYYLNGKGSIIYDQIASYQHWKIFVIGLLFTILVGTLIEFYFTRERVTEESFASNHLKKAEVIPFRKQARVCLKDKFWWIIILFFFLYQFGGMMKNVSQLYFCQAMFQDAFGNYSVANGGFYHGMLSIFGAVPTALGMLIVWPMANHFGKKKTILLGSAVSVAGGILGFINPSSFILVSLSFCIKALGLTPSMYLSLALLADVLDHQEARTGFRSDGFTMTIYGAIMAGMTGLTTGIMNGVLSGVSYSAENVSSEAIRNAMPWLFIGTETICCGIIFLLFLFMDVEKYSSLDQKVIVLDQRSKAEREGIEYIDPRTQLEEEEKEAAIQAEEERKKSLRTRCEKKGLDYQAEEEKYEKKREKRNIKKADSEKKVRKPVPKTEKTPTKDILTEFNRLREESNQPQIQISPDGEVSYISASTISNE